MVKRRDDDSLSVSVYRKPTQTDQYLNFESHHPLELKLSVARTLLHRAHFAVQAALKNCGYERWTFHKARKPKVNKSNPAPVSANVERKINVTTPYVKVISEKLRRVFQQYGICLSYKPLSTIRQCLVAPQDKTNKEDQTRVVYFLRCNNCDLVYIGETARKL